MAMVSFPRRHSNATSRSRLTLADAQPICFEIRTPSNRIRKLLRSLPPLTTRILSIRIQAPGSQKHSITPSSPPTPAIDLLDHLENILEEKIAKDVALLGHQNNLMRPISTAGLAHAKNMKDGFVTCEDIVGEGFVRWMDEDRSYPGPGNDRPAWARSMQKGGPTTATEAAKRDKRSTCEETSIRQIKVVREKPTVSTKKEKVYHEKTMEMPPEQDVLAEEVPVSAEVDDVRYWAMTQSMSMADKVDVSDNDSDYISWTLEDQWELEGRLEEMIWTG